MATEYKTTKNESGVYDITRNGEHVASYDPVSETTTLVKEEYNKYANLISKEVSSILSGGTETPTEETPKADVPDDIPSIPIPDDPATLKRIITGLQIENAHLRDRISKVGGRQTTPSIPERFSDPVDLTGAPPQDPNLGDLTPTFIAWARENFPPDIFTKRYAGRLQD